MLKPITASVPAIRGYFGSKLLSFQTQLHPRDVAGILGHDPRSDHWKSLATPLRERYEHVQRSTDKARRDSLMQYISDHIGADHAVIGAFPAICIGMTQPVVFEPFSGEEESIGFLKLELDGSHRILLDGLARVTAALTLIDHYNSLAGEMGPWAVFAFPVTFYAPQQGALTIDELGQLFYDFNYLQKRISTQHAIALDQSDLYIRLTNELGGRGVLKRYGGMDMRASSLAKQSKAIVVQQVLLRFVRGACEGATFQQSNHASTETPTLTHETYAGLSVQLESYLDALATKMGTARFADRDALHLTSPGWQVLGLVFHDLYVRLHASPSTVESIIQRLAAIDWSRFNPDWLSCLGEPEIDKKTGVPLEDAQGRFRVKVTRLGSAGIARLKDYVYDKTGLAVLTADLQKDEVAA